MPKHLSARALVRTRRPEFPVYCLRHHAVDTASRWFQQHFPGRVLFAVKTNPLFVQTLAKSGLRHFDVASIAEIEEVAANVPNARMSFMHPVKNRDAIRRAYFDFGVRDFALDSEEELKKILDETNCAKDLNLFVRIAVNNRHSRMSLSGKFGISGREARRLLFKVRQVGRGLGVCFHAGSQIMHPRAYVEAMKRVAKCIRRSGVIIDYLDIGGGFPSAYPYLAPSPMQLFIDAIIESFNEMPVSETCELWCEPGRALVAEGASLVVKVEHRKGNLLYINDGVFGGLFDAGQPGFIYPVRSLSEKESAGRELTEFSFFGPTCDSMDFMQGPFLLPIDVSEGDYIEIGSLGAYSLQLRTQFNGFNYSETVEVSDGPLLSMYGLVESSKMDAVTATSPELVPIELSGETY